MAKVLELTTVPKETTTEPKKKRERIVLIETPPKPEWFVSTREGGRTVWYLRFTVTGMLPRRFGPFQSRHKALLALDAIIDVIETGELEDRADEYVFKRRFHKTWGCIMEDELALPTKGGGR